jgi:membrane-associated phospholipid phosphatase
VKFFVLLILLCGTTPISAALDPQDSFNNDGCWQIASQVPRSASMFTRALASTPREALRPSNLRWELPIAAATGLLIATSDEHINSHIQSASFTQAAARGSNVGLGIELGVAGLTYLLGCSRHRSSYAANSGFTALEAIGAANVITYGLKIVTNRQYAYHTNSRGEFWEGGKSFPSGHAATSFAFASVIAHRYPHNPWLNWGVYGLATGVSLARVGGKKHFASDILVGGTLGYVTGTYFATH